MGLPAAAASLHPDRPGPDRTARDARPSSGVCSARRVRRYSCAGTPARSGRRARQLPPGVRVRSGFPHAPCSRAGRLPGRARYRVCPGHRTTTVPAVAAHAARRVRRRMRLRSHPHVLPAFAESAVLRWLLLHRTARTAPAAVRASRPRVRPMPPGRRRMRRSGHRSGRARAARPQAPRRCRCADSCCHLPRRGDAGDGIGQRGVVGLAVGALPQTRAQIVFLPGSGAPSSRPCNADCAPWRCCQRAAISPTHCHRRASSAAFPSVR